MILHYGFVGNCKASLFQFRSVLSDTKSIHFNPLVKKDLLLVSIVQNSNLLRFVIDKNAKINGEEVFRGNFV